MKEIASCKPVQFWGRWVFLPLLYLPEEMKNSELQALLVNREDGLSALTSPIVETLIPWAISDKELRKLCREYGVLIGWVTNRYPPNKPSESRRKKDRETSVLSGAEYRRFLATLKRVNKQMALIAQLLWFLNKETEQDEDFIYLTDLLRLQAHDLSSDPKAPWVCIERREQRLSIAKILPRYLWSQAYKQIQSHTFFVFSNRRGELLHVAAVNKCFAKAAEQARLGKTVGALSLRAGFKKKGFRVRKKLSNGLQIDQCNLEEVTGEEWSELCANIPGLKACRGRESQYSPRMKLNAILYHFKTNCPFHKLPSHYPSGAAVLCQYKRWLKSEILNRIFAFRFRP